MSPEMKKLKFDMVEFVLFALCSRDWKFGVVTEDPVPMVGNRAAAEYITTLPSCYVNFAKASFEHCIFFVIDNDLSSVISEFNDNYLGNGDDFPFIMELEVLPGIDEILINNQGVA